MIAIFSNAVFLPPFCKDVANISVAPSDTFVTIGFIVIVYVPCWSRYHLQLGIFNYFVAASGFHASLESFFTSLRTTRAPAAGLSATHVCTDRLLDWSLAAK